jgi:tight adherence protein C
VEFLIQIVVEVLTFGVVAFAAISAMRAAASVISVRRRLSEAGPAAQVGDSPLVKNDQVRNPFLQWVETSTLANDDKERAKLRRDLSLAGMESAVAPVAYVITRFCLAIGMPLVFIFTQAMSAKPITGMLKIEVPLILCGAGLILPRMWLDRRISSRKARLEEQFPDALDLMVVCVEAGLGLEAAFVRVGREVDESHPRIAEEFGRLTDELAAGRARDDALRRMADRVEVEMLRSFTALIIQTEALGGSVGQSLRTYSAEMRETRFLRAEEKAMRIPVLMTIPLVVCILPVIVTSIMLPPMLDIVRVLLPAMKGHR